MSDTISQDEINAILWRACDTVCGSASLLIKCANQVDGRDVRNGRSSGDYALYGQEVNGSTWALAKMNMFLHDVSQADVQWGDTLKHPTLLEGERLRKYDVVVANPPFFTGVLLG